MTSKSSMTGMTSMTIWRGVLPGLCAVALQAATSSASLAQVSLDRGAQTVAVAYPTRTVSVVVPVGPGGAPDLFARILSEHLQGKLGQPFIVENRPGVGGNLAMQAVARAPADGHALLLMTTPHAINATLFPVVDASLERDIAPVIGLLGDNFVMVVNPDWPIKSLPEFLAFARANPGRINMASSGAGNLSHLTGEMFKMKAGVDMVHVPYRSTPAALSDVMNGNVHLMFDAIPSARSNIEGGKLRALGVTGAKPHPQLPGVPAIGDLVPGFDVTGWMGIGVARATPQPIIDKLAAEIAASLAAPSVQARLAELGSNKLQVPAADFARLLAEDTARWAEVIRHAGLKGR